MLSLGVEAERHAVAASKSLAWILHNTCCFPHHTELIPVSGDEDEAAGGEHGQVVEVENRHPASGRDL